MKKYFTIALLAFSLFAIDTAFANSLVVGGGGNNNPPGEVSEARLRMLTIAMAQAAREQRRGVFAQIFNHIHAAAASIMVSLIDAGDDEALAALESLLVQAQTIARKIRTTTSGTMRLLYQVQLEAIIEQINLLTSDAN